MKKYVLPLLVSVLFMGCRLNYNYRLGAGLHTHDLVYQPKPLAPPDSSVNTATYVGGVIVFGKGYVDRPLSDFSQHNDRHQLGLLQMSRAHSWKAATISYGAFAYAGTYSIGSDSFSEYARDLLGKATGPRLPSIYEGTYGFYGLGLRGSAQLNAMLGRYTNWRFIGLEWAVSREYGALTDVRQRIPQQSIINDDRGYGMDHWHIARDRHLGTVALSTEMVLHSGLDRALTVKYSLGKTFGTYEKAGWFNASNFTLAYQYHHHFVSLMVGNNFYKSATQVSYTYRLNQRNKKKMK